MKFSRRCDQYRERTSTERGSWSDEIPLRVVYDLALLRLLHHVYLFLDMTSSVF